MAYLLGFGIPIIYLFCIGFFAPRLKDWFYSREGFDFRSSVDANVMAVLCMILLPAALPLLAGLYLSKRQVVPRVERKRTKELAKAEHRAKLVAMREKEIELLEREVGIIKH